MPRALAESGLAAGSSALADCGLAAGSRTQFSSSSMSNSTYSQQLPVNNRLSPGYSAYSSDEDNPRLGVHSLYIPFAKRSSPQTKPKGPAVDVDHPNSSTLVRPLDINQDEVDQDTNADSCGESSYLSSDTYLPHIEKSSPSSQHWSSGDELDTKKVKSEVTVLASSSRVKRKASSGVSYVQDLCDEDGDDHPGYWFSSKAKRQKRPGNLTPAVKFAIADWMGKYNISVVC